LLKQSQTHIEEKGHAAALKVTFQTMAEVLVTPAQVKKRDKTAHCNQPREVKTPQKWLSPH